MRGALPVPFRRTVTGADLLKMIALAPRTPAWRGENVTRKLPVPPPRIVEEGWTTRNSLRAFPDRTRLRPSLDAVIAVQSRVPAAVDSVQPGVRKLGEDILRRERIDGHESEEKNNNLKSAGTYPACPQSPNEIFSIGFPSREFFATPDSEVSERDPR